jgi:protein tyrosine/serine phosphatase
MSDRPERFVGLEGCSNFRDLGGWSTRTGQRVRRGLVFRSDALHELSAGDVQHLRERIGIRAVIDLRTPVEVESDLHGALIEPPVRYHHVSLLPPPRPEARELEPGESFALDRFYLGILRRGGRGVARVLELLAESAEPAVFHCAAGKDRTGVIAALLLALLEVDDEQIAQDYALTQHGLEGIADRLRRSQGYTDLWQDLPSESLHARADTMHAWLARVRSEWGSAEAYARAVGLAPEALARLRGRLVE